MRMKRHPDQAFTAFSGTPAGKSCIVRSFWRFLLLIQVFLLLGSVRLSAQSLNATAQAGSIACIGGTTTLVINASGGQPPYQYSIDGVQFQSSNTFAQVPAGSYGQMTVTDAQSSSFTLSIFSISNGTLPSVVYYADVDADGYGDSNNNISGCTGAPAGYAVTGGDCNDLDNLIYPGAAESCNTVDDNCNGLVDDVPGAPLYYPDNDGDGYGTGSGTVYCADPGTGWSLTGGDCNDANGIVYPNQTEVCNSIDDDCDNAIDEGLVFENYWADADNDQYGSGNPVSLCADPGTGYATNGSDCNDSDHSIHPAATETCNGIDDNCNGLLDSSDPLLASAGTLTLTASADPILCNGGTVDVTLTPSGGVSPYRFGSQPTDNLGAGQYTFTVTDVNGCTGATTLTLTQPGAILGSASSSSIACNGGTSILTVTATGGTGTLSGTGSFLRSAGPYSYTITDDNGCTLSVTGTISQPAALTVTESYDPIPCNGGTTEVTIAASGGTSPYNGTGVFTESAGLHTYTVTDDNGCVATTQFTLSEPAPLAVSSAYQPIAIFGGSSTVTITASGGTTPYQGVGQFTQSSGTMVYEVTDASGCRGNTTVTLVEPGQLSATAVAGSIACNGGTTSLTVSASGGVTPYSGTGTFQVFAGPYSITVTDANGASFVVVGTISQPAVLTASSTSGTVLCQGGTTVLNVNAAGGTAPYSGTGTYTRGAGSYTFTVTDANGCTASATEVVADGPAVVVSLTQTAMPLCYGQDGTVSVTAAGGGTSYIGTGTFQVPAGLQSFTVTDNNGCVGTASVTVVQPDLLAVQTVPTHVACHGASTGQIALNITGGTSPMSALWSNGSTQLTATGLAAASYTVVVTDDNGCTEAAGTTLTQPAPLPNLDSIQGITSACVPYAPGSNPYSVSPISDGVNTTVYNWTVPSGMSVASGQGSSSATISWTSTAVDASISGTISVQASNGCVIKTRSIPIRMAIVTPVTPPSISGPSKLCPGDTGVFSISQVPRATGYQWTFPSGMTAIGSAFGNVVCVLVNNAYTGGSISVAAENACGVSPVRTRSTVLNTVVTPGVISGQTSGLCGMSGLTYSITPVTGATSYSWTVPANSYILSGQGTHQITVDFNGSAGGSIKVSAANSCGSSPERSLTVNTIPARPDPITPSTSPCAGTTVGYSVPTVLGAIGYNWTTTSGASITSGQGTKSISIYWNPAATGTSQTMVVRASNACGISNSRALTLTVRTCIREQDETESRLDNISVYPNPTGGPLFIRFESQVESPVTIRILDLTGRLLSTETHVVYPVTNELDYSGSLPDPNGVYFIELEQEGSRVRTRVVVE